MGHPSTILNTAIKDYNKDKGHNYIFITIRLDNSDFKNPDPKAAEIDLNTEKSSRKLRNLAVAQTSGKATD